MNVSALETGLVKCLNIIFNNKCFQQLIEGPKCDVELKSCKQVPCKNAGTCVESSLFEGFLCLCPPGHSGVFCEKPLCDNKLCEPNGNFSLNCQTVLLQ
jgi:hypothetical protein